MIKFSERLKELRIEKGLSQIQLAKDLNITQSTITRWEVGNRFPSIFVLIEIAKYFNVTLDYLVGIEN